MFVFSLFVWLLVVVVVVVFDVVFNVFFLFFFYLFFVGAGELSSSRTLLPIARWPRSS